MSFYWQQGLQNQDTGQPTQQPQQQQGQWDFINLGGAPAPQHQWNPSAAQQQQQQNYYYQQQQPQQNGPLQHYHQAAGQQIQQQWAQQPVPTQQFHQVPTPQQPVIEHTPILQQPVQQQYPPNNRPQTQSSASRPPQGFNPAPPIFAPSHQQQHQEQPHVPKEVSPAPQPPQPAATHQTTFPPPPVAQFNSAPPSKEVTPELQQYAAQHQAQEQARAWREAEAKAQAKAKARAQTEADEKSRAEAEAQALAITQARVQAQAQAALLQAQAETQLKAQSPQTKSYHAPLPTPPVLKPVVPIAVKSLLKKDQEVLTVAAVPTTGEVKTKITPTSSEDDWEKADFEVQRVDDENKKSARSTVPAEKPEESRESSSLGGSWSQQDTEPSERNSVEPVEILGNLQTLQEDKGEKTPRVSMSENFGPTPVPTSHLIVEERQETPDARLEISGTLSSSPGEAIATSTPKEVRLEKRASVSSQGTIHAEKEKTMIESQPKPHKLHEEDERSGNNSDSTLASGKPEFERGHARASYREYKKTYLEICDRLKIMRSDSHHSDFRPSSKLANPLLAAAGLARHPAIRRESTGGRNDGRASVPLPQSQSFTDNSFQNGGRRSRVSRLDPNARPSSRQSGYANAGYTNDSRLVNPYDQQRFVQQQHPRYRQGRYSAMGVPYRGYPQEGYDPRRPQSTYMMEQYPNNYGQEPQETSSFSESDEEDENAESDDELRRYNMQNQSRRNHPEVQYHPAHDNGEDGDALYYCGVVHINMDIWRRVKEKHPLPQDFYGLSPIEKAAFMFYAVVYGQLYKDVGAFHKKFNREFYKHACDGDSDDRALFKICTSMQAQYHARQEEKKAQFQQMKATLFSDDTDGQSEINSVYEESLHSCDTRNNGPLKFTHPHCFLNISTGGQIISILPEKSTSVVHFDDIRSMLKDIPTLQVKEAAQTFKGPLIPKITPPHTVRLYISKQIENIKRSAVAVENPEANDVVESLLVWQLLETMVKQQGNITGPDIAELLAKVANQQVNIEAPPQQSNITPALNQFTQFLLGGHIDEAVESAIRNGLFADALVLTRRLFPNDERRIEQIENRFLQTRSLSNPVTTLVTVAKGETPPVLTNPPLDDHLSWRTHAAIILANLDGTAISTIYQLGRALAKRDYHCAADFCFIVYCVLGGNNPFEPIKAEEGEEEYRRHISLVNSDIPDNESNPKCQYGFLLTDLHATEIFDYALRLNPNRQSPLSESVEYQTSRIKYAKLLANHGFNTDAYRYCTEIARSIWEHFTKFNQDDLLELCDLAESLHYGASVDVTETQWIHNLRTMILSGYAQQQTQQQQIVHHQEPEIQNYGNQPEPAFEISTEPLQPTPVPVLQVEPISMSTPASEPVRHQQYYQEENGYMPPTEEQSVNQELPALQHDVQYTDHHQQHVAVPPQPQYQTGFNEEDGFTTPPDYSDGPLTMASSPPVVETPTPPLQIQQQVPPQPPPQVESQSSGQPTQQQAPPSQLLPNEQNSWISSLQKKVQKVIPGQNPMKLPDDKNPGISWDPAQNKWVGDGVEQEAVAPPPPTIQTAPKSVQGGGIRTARGASRYAQVGLGGSANGPTVPSGMAPPMSIPKTFGFMPAPIDDDADSVDPFSGQANPTIQSASQPPVEK